MVRILLASHGNLASGMLSSLELILGKQDNVETLCAYLNGEDNVTPRVEEFISRIKEGERWIVFTDLFGGRVNNEFVNHLEVPGLRVVAGMNLPMVIAAALASGNTDDPDEIIGDLKGMLPDMIHFCTRPEAFDEADEEF